MDTAACDSHASVVGAARPRGVMAHMITTTAWPTADPSNAPDTEVVGHLCGGAQVLAEPGTCRLERLHGREALPAMVEVVEVHLDDVAARPQH